MRVQTSADSPLPVRTVSRLIGEWIGRLGGIWVDGQVAEITRRPGLRTAWVTLRDVEVDMSLSVVVDVATLDRCSPPLTQGQRVVISARPEFHSTRGQLQLRAREITPVGRGALLEELERVRALLQAEGVFADARKRRLPFLPRRVGLVSGRASAALKDVLVNARARWPAVAFEVREVAVQGHLAVSQVVDALAELNAIGDVDVIVIARGGGSVEDLLPFSNERLVRAVAASRAPVVSAIGHEQDVPLVDLAADVRASTPTDAAKRIVPDAAEEQRTLATLNGRLTRATLRRIERDEDARHRQLLSIRRAVTNRLHGERTQIDHLLARARALSPQATLERGYAVVRLVEDGAPASVLRDARDADDGQELDIRVAIGSLRARAGLEGPA